MCTSYSHTKATIALPVERMEKLSVLGSRCDVESMPLNATPDAPNVSVKVRSRSSRIVSIWA
jgi:hypothetical protein